MHQSGFFRVSYSPRGWKRIARALLRDVDSFSGLDRAGLLEDAFSLARAGQLSYASVLELTKYLPSEFEFVPWIIAAGGFSYMRDRLTTSPVYSALEQHVLAMATNLIQRLVHRRTRSHHAQLLKALAFAAGWVYGHPRTRFEAKKAFNNFINTPFRSFASIPKDNLRVVLKAGIETGGTHVWNALWRVFVDPRLPFGYKNPVLGALASSRSPWMLAQLLHRSLNLELMSRAETVYVFALVSNNPVGRRLAWAFFKAHYDVLAAHSLPLYSLVQSMADLDTQAVRECIGSHLLWG